MRLRAALPTSLALVAAMACSPDALTGPRRSTGPDLEPAPLETPAVVAYFPPSDASGGWRRLTPINTTPTAQNKATIRSVSGLDWDRLKQAWDSSSRYGGSFIVIRNGWIAAEFGTTSAMAAASCTKTFTSLTVHRMFERSAAGGLTNPIGPDDFAYRYLPASWGSDVRRRSIQVRHLLTMSSGLVPDDRPPAPGSGTTSYQQKLLAPPVRTTPGAEWSYASLPVDVLSLVATNATGMKLGDFFQQQIGAAIGVTTLKWASLGSHTYGSAYSTLTGRDMARIMYLLLQRGTWNGTSLVSGERIDAMTQWDPSLANAIYGPQDHFPTDPATHLRYGRLTWTNHTQSPFVGSGVPADAYYCAGYKTNFATVIPSLDLVIVRLQNGPAPWSDAVFKSINSKVVSAVVGTGGNVAPTVVVTTPSAGASFVAGSTITIAATSADPDGEVAQVEFFANGAPIGSASTRPYSISWTGVAPGDYSLTARSTDNLGAAATSAAVGIAVAGAPPDNASPTAVITSPSTGAGFVAGAHITIAAEATDTDGSVTRAEFFAGSTPVGAATSAPYTVTWNSVPAGTYALTVRSTDDDAASTTSAVVSITVASPPSTGNLAPTVRITNPANGAAFRPGSTITLTASAADADGSIAKVTFYAGTNHLYTDTVAPYSYVWRNVAAGSYPIMARATDNLGKKASTTVNISVTN